MYVPTNMLGRKKDEKYKQVPIGLYIIYYYSTGD
jgi:hypothetical protein